MTTTIPDDELARFRLLMRQLEQIVAGPSQQAAVAPDGLPGHVAAGELIESAWGNATSDSVRFARYHLTSAIAAPISLSGGWGSGLRQIGGAPYPAIGAAMQNQVTVMCVAHYMCTGAAGSGADLAGGTTRTRFRLTPGADAGISFIRTATSDQQVMVETFQTNLSIGTAAGNLEIWTETSKPCNVSGSAMVWLVPGGVTFTPSP